LICNVHSGSPEDVASASSSASFFHLRHYWTNFDQI